MISEPAKQVSFAARRERQAGVSGAVVEVDGVVVGAERVAAGERDVADIPVALVLRFGTEDPRFSACKAHLGLVESEEGDAETIQARHPATGAKHALFQTVAQTKPNKTLGAHMS